MDGGEENSGWSQYLFSLDGQGTTSLVSTSRYALNEDQARSLILNSVPLDFYRAREDRSGDSGTTCSILESLNHTHRDKAAKADQNVR